MNIKRITTSLALGLTLSSWATIAQSEEAFSNASNQSENATTIKLDFGQSETVSNWNVISGRSKKGLLTNAGDVSDINFKRINGTFFSGLMSDSRVSYPEVDAIYPEQVMKDGFYGKNKPYSEFKLTGLDASSEYTLNFFASTKWNTKSSYHTSYIVTGKNAETTHLEAQSNDGKKASVLVKPSASGELTVRIKAGPDNTSSGKMYFLNALTISKHVPIISSDELVSKTSGIAPLVVNFNAGAEGEDFHNRSYQWDFGDKNSGHWSGVDDRMGLSKNTDTGPIAGHVYTKPGTYTATLRVSDHTGEITGLTKQVIITVADPNEVFSGEKTKCISSTGNFANCPAGAEQLTYNGQQFMNNIRNIIKGNRLLLRRGDSWKVKNELQGYTTDENVYISAYGDCNSPDTRGICANAPIINNDAAQPILRFAPKSNNILIEHIHFTATDRQYPSINASSNVSNLTLHKLKTTVADGMFSAEARNYSLIDSDLSGGHSSILYVGGRNLVIQGNHFHDSYSSHLLRLMSPYKSVISHNVLHSTEVDPQRKSRGSMVLKLHGLDPVLSNSYLYETLGVEPTFAQYIVVSNNFFGKGGSWPVAVSPSNATWNESITDVILEKNTHSCAYGNDTTIGTLDKLPSSHCARLLSIQAQGVTVRNNILDLQDAGRVTSNGAIAYPTAISVKRFATVTGAPAPQDVKVYNNTINIPKGVTYANSPMWLSVGADATGIEFINNLLTKPSASASRYIDDKSDSALFDNNLFVDDAGFVNASDSHILNRDYRLLPESPAINTGIALPRVIDDFNSTSRSGEVSDVGAYKNHN